MPEYLDRQHLVVARVGHATHFYLMWLRFSQLCARAAVCFPYLISRKTNKLSWAVRMLISVRLV